MIDGETRREFVDKKALVTGGSRGIGRAVCLELARRGADVAFIYHSRDVEAGTTTGDIRALGRVALALKTDLADAHGVGTAIDRAAAFGGSIFGAGGRRHGSWHETAELSTDDWIATWRSTCRELSTHSCGAAASAQAGGASLPSRRSPRKCARRVTCGAAARPGWRRSRVVAREEGRRAFARKRRRRPHRHRDGITAFAEWGRNRPTAWCAASRCAGSARRGGRARRLLSGRACRRLHHRQVLQVDGGQIIAA